MQKRGDETCEARLDQARTLLELDSEDLQRIEVYVRIHRYKRGGCNTCGWLLSKMTGVMDAYTAQEYTEKINQLQNESISQHELMKSQSRLSEVTLKTGASIIKALDNRTLAMMKSLNDVNNYTSQIDENNFSMLELMLESNCWN